MQKAIGIPFPIEADSVLSPVVNYGDPVTAIHFVTDDDQFGRLTFENFDSIRVCRGEFMPYEDSWDLDSPYYWVREIENSLWLKERYEYEAKHYGDAYEWGGDVNEMLTQFKHYLFSFHDEYVEVLAKGVWYEKDEECLQGKPPQDNHPLNSLPEDKFERFEAHGLSCQIRVNSEEIETLKKNTKFCSQKLMQFALELEGSASVNHTLKLVQRDNKVVSTLNSYFGKEELTFEGVASFDDVKPYIENYMKEVAERRRQMGK